MNIKVIMNRLNVKSTNTPRCPKIPYPRTVQKHKEPRFCRIPRINEFIVVFLEYEILEMSPQSSCIDEKLKCSSS